MIRGIASQRLFLGSVLLLAQCAGGPLWADGPAGKDRPNLLYIFTDQQTSAAMSCAGNVDLQTPGMDSLAGRGVRFENAYCAQPLCMPSRTAMFTGLNPHETGATDNAARWERAPVPMLGATLAAGGYRCAWFGKWHLPISEKETKEHGFAVTENTRGRGNDDRLADAIEQFLAKPQPGPWFVVASFLNPHNICEWARSQETPEGPIDAAPPPEQCPALPANFEIPFDEPEVVREIQARHPPGDPTTGWAPDRWRQYRWAYYRLVEKVDAQIARLLDVLRRSGFEKNTVIIFSADHGDGNAAHRWNQKQVLYEESARVPLIVVTPGQTSGHVDGEHLVNSGLDLYPTLCDFAGVAAPKHVRGQSLRPLLAESPPAAWRGWLVTETEFANNAGGIGVTGRVVRTARYKYICYSQGARREQLFDMAKDPGETLNLARAAEAQEVLQEHRQHLAEWCRQTKDAFPVPGID